MPELSVLQIDLILLLFVLLAIRQSFKPKEK